MAKTDSAYKGITEATVSLAFSFQSYSVWSVHSSEAHYSFSQQRKKHIPSSTESSFIFNRLCAVL